MDSFATPNFVVELDLQVTSSSTMVAEDKISDPSTPDFGTLILE